MHMLHVPARQ